MGDPSRINVTSFWHAGDKEALYKKHTRKKETLDLLVENDWLNKKIFYRFNNQGFRSIHDYSDTNVNVPLIAAFGCSNTLGEGVTEEQRWSNLLAQMIGARVYNFGVSGAGVGTNYRHAYYWLPQLKFKAVFWLVPIPERLDFVDNLDKKCKTITAHEHHGHKNFRSEWLANDLNSLLYQDAHVRAMQSLCDKYDIPLYMLHREEWKMVDRARDLRHPGRDSHSLLAKHFYNLANIKR